uniref:FIST domain-containing protein n=1 Tax=Mycena chlorophos TaxID=658473 RepID=A0ABQ0LH77_MYCCL|nr:predicted protein [Mycena chlorophos]
MHAVSLPDSGTRSAASWTSILSAEPPSELRGLRPEDIGTILYLTDGAPEGLSNSLSRFTRANKIGLFAASTPFITGRPVTLFKNGEICDSGAVGVAISHPATRCGMRFVGLEPLAKPMTVSQSEGNLVVALDNKNPTQLLLAAIREKGINLTTPDYEEFGLATFHDDQPSQMFVILSGDPSRGTIALRSMSAPPPGSRVQFFHRPKSNAIQTVDDSSRKTFGFTVVPETLAYEQFQQNDEGGFELELPDSFLAGSERGFLVSRANEAPWTCSIPGSSVELE